MQTVETAHQIPREQLAHSPFQKPRVSNRGNLEELAASMREVGVLEPLIVRPAPAGSPEGITHELVAGHRRDLAAEIAGLPTVPCLVRDYTDDQVLEVIAIENGQREGVHPLDECDLFAELVKRGRTVVEIADKVGRPTPYVAQRLKLSDLSEKGREALDQERISLGAALALARVPAKLQDRALADVVVKVEEYEDEGQVTSLPTATAKDVQRTIRNKYMLKLADAPFPLEDAKLVKKAGACSACPKRTGNQQALFADVTEDLCTDPECFKGKAAAHWPTLAKEREAAGQRVLDAKEAKRAVDGYNSEYVQLDGEHYNYNTGKRVEVSKLLEKAGVASEVVVARDEQTGRVVELVARKDVAKAEAALKPKAKAAAGGEDYAAKDAAKRKAELRKERRQKRVVQLALEGAVAGVEAAKDKDAVMAVIMRAYVQRSLNDAQKAVIARRGLEPIKHKQSYGGATTDAEGTLLKLFDSQTPAQQRGLCVELALAMHTPRQYGGGGKEWTGPLKLFGVNLEKLEAQVAAEDKAKTDAKKAKGAKPKSPNAPAAAKAKPAKKGKAKR
jgi:ParB/RepB/Spo0J family partition protein